MKRLLEKLERKKLELQQQMQKGREVTEQMKADKIRKKHEKSKHFEPGTFRYGLFHRQGVLDFMKDVKERREQKQKIK